MKTRLPELMARKQLDEKRMIDSTTLKKEVPLSRPTIAKWLKGDVKSFDENTILAFCHYFKCDVGDLLTIVENNNGDK